MNYCIRILGIFDKKISLHAISHKKITSLGFLEDINDWYSITVYSIDGEIFTIKKEKATDRSGKELLSNFEVEIEKCYPKKAVGWLRSYFSNVKVIYSICPTEKALLNNNLDIVSAIQEIIWTHVGGIIQIDNEGFTNEDGFHILWQFDKSASGKWKMAILNENDEWEAFEINLENLNERKLFQDGKSRPQ